MAAPPCDLDDDGYDSDAVGCQGPPGFEDVVDCDDNDAAVNPGALDVYRDGLDSDCDGSDRVLMRLSESFSDLDEWETSLQADPPEGSVANNGDVVIMDPYFDSTTSLLVDSWVTLSGTIDWPRGEAWATVRVQNLTNATCELTVVGDNSMTETFSSTGIHQVDLSPAGVAPFTIDELELRCYGTGVASIDFVTLGTYPYIWPPDADLNQNDLVGHWVETNTPMGGATNNVLLFDGQDLYAASDVGGAAWTDDGQVWNVMNDLDNDADHAHLWPSEELAIWDLASDGSGRVWALTGDKNALSVDGSDNVTVDAGGLYSTVDGGDTWTRDFGAEDGIAAYGRIWDCEGGEVVARAGGHLMALNHHPSTTVPVPTTHWALYVGSHATTAPGVHLVDDTGQSCAISLPGAPDAPVSALVLADGATQDTENLLIGFKADAGEPGLMRCEVPSTAESPPSCADTSNIVCEVVSGSNGLDVRDIEVDPLDSMVAYVADGGRESSSGSCVFTDPKALEWTRSWSAGVWSDTVVEPASLGVTGASTETELVGLVVSPVVVSKHYLFAFFPGGQHRDYGDVRFPTLKRTSVAGSSWSWIDLENAEVTTEDHTNKQQRWPGISAGLDASGDWADRDHWIDDQVARPLWAPAFAVDGLFTDVVPSDFDCSYSGGNECLVIADGFGIWFVDGWFWSDSTDFDSALHFRHAVPDDFQLTVATDLSVLALDGLSDLVWGTAKDIGVTLAGEVRRGEVPCQFADWAGPGAAVDTVWETSLDDSHVWVALGNGAEDKRNGPQAIFHSADAGTTWCWTGTGGAGVFAPASTSTQCQFWEDWTGDPDPASDPITPWPECSPGAMTFGPAPSMDVGSPTDLEALDDNGDVLVAAVQSHTSTTTDGLILTTDGGVTWDTVANFSMSFHKAGVQQDCTQSEFFAGDVHVAVRQGFLDDGGLPQGSWFNDASDYQFEVVVNGAQRNGSGGECGLLIARWNSTTDGGTMGSGATWEQIFLSQQVMSIGGAADTTGNTDPGSVTWPQNGICPFDALGPTDVAFDPQDPERLLVTSRLQRINGGLVGGVCLIEWEPEGSNTYRDRQALVDASQVPISFTRVLPHPDLQHSYLLASRLERADLDECAAQNGTSSPPLFGCAAPKPRIVSGDPLTEVWSVGAFDTSGLTNGNFNDLAWGGDDRTVPGLEPMEKVCFSDLYAATNGSGIYQWSKWWQIGTNPCD